MHNLSSSGSTELNETPLTTFSEVAAIQEEGLLSNGLKKRISDATANLESMDRCLLTHTQESARYCHVLSRTTPEHEISRLEYSWGMRYGQLNLDTSSNIFYLTSDLHRSFHRGLWILVPEDTRILQTYEDHTNRGLEGNHFLNLLPAGPYRYRLFVSWYMQPVTITRHFMPTDQPGEGDYIPRKYEYPFHEFPALISHIHPRFAICHAGRILAKRWSDFVTPHLGTHGTLTAILYIYKSWTRRVPSKNGDFFLQGIRLAPSTGESYLEDQESEGSECTRAERYNWTQAGLTMGTEPPSTHLTQDSILALNAFNSQQASDRRDSVSRWLTEIQNPSLVLEWDSLESRFDSYGG